MYYENKYSYNLRMLFVACWYGTSTGTVDESFFPLLSHSLLMIQVQSNTTQNVFFYSFESMHYFL